MRRHLVGLMMAWLAAISMANAIEWRDGDRVVLIGNTFVERAQTYGHLETALAAGLAGRNITFRNLGWSGDTVYGDARSYFGPPQEGFDRLANHLEEIKPTVIVSVYGAVAAFDGPAGVEPFQKGYARLLDMMVEKTGARVVLMTPPPLENLPAPLPNQDAQNQHLALYRDGIQALAGERGYEFADLFEALGAGRLANRRPSLTENGVHYTEQGYAVIAPMVANLLGVGAEPMVATGASNTFQLTPKNLAGNVINVTVAGLEPGDHTLHATDGRAILTASHQFWQAGATIHERLWPVEYDRLRQAVIAKNQVFFHRWRPQNETYLFGFRKHEQGNNAVEVPQFDPIVAAADVKIQALAQPQAVTLTLTKRSSN